ncbi:MAG: ankyrin repeat domain-containing protein [Ruminococcus flavefaciens]|nr:ankyrin repeat domain-containing protein [Ruminococcus flavefaciens]MCM1230391.1 ankyrin repeat domain-containing protein [Ruminococcus flavefaciens]
MNKLFKDIRHSDIEAVRKAISKNIAVVNEVYSAKAPKKDIGQSPLQVAIKCGEFEIIELLIANGADTDFMEDSALVPTNSVCMSVLHDAIICAFSALCYKKYDQSEKYINLIKILLESGANPNRKTSSEMLPIGTAVNGAEIILTRDSAYPDIQEITQKRLFEVLDILIKYGADEKEWLNQNFWGVSNKVHYFEEKMYGIDNVDIMEPIRNTLKEYFDYL